MKHKLVTQVGFISGFDAHCDTCYSPGEYATADEMISNATNEEVNEWYAEHVRLSAK